MSRGKFGGANPEDDEVTVVCDFGEGIAEGMAGDDGGREGGKPEFCGPSWGWMSRCKAGQVEGDPRGSARTMTIGEEVLRVRRSTTKWRNQINAPTTKHATHTRALRLISGHYFVGSSDGVVTFCWEPERDKGLGAVLKGFHLLVFCSLKIWFSLREVNFALNLSLSN